MRWVAVLPAAFSAIALVLLLLLVFVLDEEGRDFAKNPHVISLHFAIPANCLLGFAFVRAGVTLAPRHKPVVAMILTAILAALCGVAYAHVAARPGADWFDVTWALLCFALNVGCALATTIAVQRQETMMANRRPPGRQQQSG